MESYVTVQDLRHQGIERTPACGNGVQNFRAVGLPFNRILDGLNLPAYAADAVEHFLLVAKYVCQSLPSYTLQIVYPAWYTFGKRAWWGKTWSGWTAINDVAGSATL